MNIVSFILQLAGWTAAALAVFVLVSHASPAIDVIHTATTLGRSTPAVAFIIHFALAIFLAGIAYLLISAANRM